MLLQIKHEDEEFQDADNRRNMRDLDNRFARNDEFSDSEDEDDRRNIQVDEEDQTPTSHLKSIQLNQSMMEKPVPKLLEPVIDKMETEEVAVTVPPEDTEQKDSPSTNGSVSQLKS